MWSEVFLNATISHYDKKHIYILVILQYLEYICIMISYKYKLYRTPKTKHLDAMLCEGAFIWNHSIALQRRYYRLYHKYISVGRMKAHFVKRKYRHLLHSQTTQEILERLDASYQRFFKHLSKRLPRFRKPNRFSSILFKQGGYSLKGNVLIINKINKSYKFSLSRPYEGKIKTLTIKRNSIGEFYIVMVLDKPIDKLGKTHNGASVGIDFGLKKYLTLSDGETISNPQFFKKGLKQLQKKSRNLSKSLIGSNNRERRRQELCRHYKKINNLRGNWQWELAHKLCKQYDTIFIEDLCMRNMQSLWGRKISDLAHNSFVHKLIYLADKYDVTVHKIDRFFPSSKMCTCGYINNDLRLHERIWTCPECRKVHKRDFLAANNILRQGIAELESVSKSKNAIGESSQSRLNPRILPLVG